MSKKALTMSSFNLCTKLFVHDTSSLYMWSWMFHFINNRHGEYQMHDATFEFGKSWRNLWFWIILLIFLKLIINSEAINESTEREMRERRHKNQQIQLFCHKNQIYVRWIKNMSGYLFTTAIKVCQLSLLKWKGKSIIFQITVTQLFVIYGLSMTFAPYIYIF
jgi:hypothetical protein